MAVRSVTLLGAAAALAAALAVSGCDRISALGGGGRASAFHAIDITGADYARALRLPDAKGRMRSLDDFKGKVTVVFFGYTHCPDVCPTTMLELAAAKKALGADGERVQPIFVTVDPERDTPEVLGAYVANFGPDFVALRGDAAQTQAAAKEFKVFYAKVPGSSEDTYTMDHTAGSYVFDTHGRLRLFTRYGADPSGLRADLKRLLDEKG
ncbi:MAG TPA: SCO family protein [Rubrivivax sp.]|jgi:protein SCO1/2|nr:SCO family protein [Rubrivivax sp.]